MRLLFTFIGGNGHFVPLLPVAKAAAMAGHNVAFGCGPSMVSTVEATGFKVFPLGTRPGSPPERLPLRPLDAAREDQEFRDHFARRGAQLRAPYTKELCHTWQPDIVICDETDFGGMVAAEYCDLPHVTVLVMAAGSFVRKELISEALHALRAEHNLPPDPMLEMLHRYLVLSPFPPSFRDPNYPLPLTAYSYFPQIPQPPESPMPAWQFRQPDLPTVYFTLGTVFNMESGDLFSRVLAGLRHLPINVFVTVGHYIDPGELGPQAANIIIERYIAQESILPHCSLVVSHGGSGSVAGTLAHGLPAVLIPMGADQPLNAVRCQQLGIAQLLDPIALTPDMVAAAVSEVLADSSYRQAAKRIQNEFVTLPGPEYTVQLLDRLAVQKQPLFKAKNKSIFR